MQELLKSKHVLITGGTGSFGNRMARFLFGLGASCITIFSRDEKKQYEMKVRCPEFRFVLGDVRDRSSLRRVLQGVDVVFHAAALKQVPNCEMHPFEAVQTNIIGSQLLCEGAAEAGVRNVVFLSTDKAVKPINAMGISKAMMEKIACSANREGGATVCCCTRYGNVMGSRGSVIPLFLRQIESREKLTLTIPGMTRFLMTLDESVQLVAHAIANARGGEIFVKKSPACTVLDLAKAMLLEHGDGDFERIHVIGIRPGEKIHEVLVGEHEMPRATEEDGFFTIQPEYRAEPTEKFDQIGTEYTSANTRQISEPSEIREMLRRMGQTEYGG